MTLWPSRPRRSTPATTMTKLDSYGLSLLTNDEVIAVDQAGRAARPVSQLTPQQTWFAANPDGSVTVAQFNLGDSAANGHDQAERASGCRAARTFAISGSTSHSAGVSGSLSATLPTHGLAAVHVPAAEWRRRPSRPACTPRPQRRPASPWPGRRRTGSTTGTLYNVRVDGRTFTTTANTQATVTGLRPHDGAHVHGHGDQRPPHVGREQPARPDNTGRRRSDHLRGRGTGQPADRLAPASDRARSARAARRSAMSAGART